MPRAGVARHRAQSRPPPAGKACQKRQGVWHGKQRIMQAEVTLARLRIKEGLAIASPAFTAFDSHAEYREHAAAPPVDTRVSP
jgi:hypothetical protein